MRKLMILITAAAVMLWGGEAKAARHDAAYPTVAKDQTRPVAPAQAAPGGVTSDLRNDDPCTLAPEWCGGDPAMGGATCPNLCTTKSCATKLSDQRCVKDATTGAVLYYCTNAAGRTCETYTYPNNASVCATCI
jgi:hypothetical protein